ncbi:hypothetical protein O0I10_011655 [Lichtheimia ornata]|uniref:F-box domain-containing protein n=1 Tax=Lichtheimia ornata TaxID=688661 RepID=A0AAD7UUH6_9FUNG|nr:uncharacterized protein O0I10_011655 [Lichtheimia ornata]KAJ8652710.1 hypothetical protein O0I10_011655 [Lichtheimia ornata]
MTAVENIDWTQLLNNISLTAQHGNDGNRIATANGAFKRTVEQLVQVLNDRARLFANSAQFDAALRDAAAIRTILPGSGFGYLTTGDVQCQQGRYAAAIAMYDQGLAAVPESDQYYQQLQQHRSVAVANSNKRVDYISQLPLDIVITNIIPRVDPKFHSDFLCEYLYVSRTWKERFLQQPNGLDFDFGEETETFKRGHDQLVRFAPYVQKLHGNVFDDAELEDLFSRGRFSNLKNMNICCNDTTLRRPLVNGLRLIADSLTHLAIYLSPSIQLRDILESCPNLESLLTMRVDAVMPSSPSSRYPKMKSLALYNLSDPDLTHANMVDVLSRFPFLLSLEIHYTPESSILPILREHCPYLQRLYFGARNYLLDNMDFQPNRKGVRWAYLGGGDDYDYMQDDLIKFLHQHRKTLETFDIGAEINADNPSLEISNGEIVDAGDYDPWAASAAEVIQEEDDASDTAFMRLTDIRFSDHDYPSAEAFIIWLILKAPNLNAIHLPESHILPRIAYVMTKAKRLSKLEIFQKMRYHDHNGIKQFLEHHVGLGDQSTLEKMIIHVDTQMFHVSWLPLIFKLRCLKDLNILVNTISEECLSAWEEIGQGCPALEELTLGMDGAEFVEGFMEPLRHLQKLKCIRIRAQVLPTPDFAILVTIPSLEWIYLHCNVPDFMVRVLRAGNAKLIVEKPEDDE